MHATRKIVAALAIAVAFAAGASATYYVSQPVHANPGEAAVAAAPKAATAMTRAGLRRDRAAIRAGRRQHHRLRNPQDRASPARRATTTTTTIRCRSSSTACRSASARRPPKCPCRDRARASSSAPTASCSPTRTWCRARREVTVKLTDRREFRAKVLGSDPATDIAVLRIDAKNLPVVTLGDPARTRVGDWVAGDRLAVRLREQRQRRASSRPRGARCRATPTCPSSRPTSRSTRATRAGPLFNLAGEVIGINSQIYSRSGGYQGLSFAIPIDVALQGQGPDRGDRPRHARAARRDRAGR